MMSHDCNFYNLQVGDLSVALRKKSSKVVFFMSKVIVLEKRDIKDLSDILRLAHAIGKKVFNVQWVKVSPTVFPLKDDKHRIIGYTVKVSPDNEKNA